MNIKCLGCLELRRDVVNVVEMGLKNYKITDGKLTLYYCGKERYPHQAVISGLLKPGSGILKAVAGCPEDPLGHCVLCLKPPAIHMGEDIISICQNHYNDWSKWLDAHPQRRANIAPKGRAIKANWVDIFREFVEEMRAKSRS